MRSATERKELTQVARQLFPKEVHQTLVQFIKERAQFLPLEYDGEMFSRFMAQNVGIFQHIHNQLADFVSEQFKEQVKPSYSFLSMYDNNGICPLHIDREQCLYTVDYLICQDDPTPWPIYVGRPISDEERQQICNAGAAQPENRDDILRIKKEQKFTKIELEPNDAVLYSGTHQWHYRDRINCGTADLAFFHFVPKAFNGSLV